MISFEKKNIIPYMVQVGSGANGGYIIQQIAQMMNIFGVSGRYIIADPDVVEEKNLSNQLFIPKDVGKKKASVLATRYGGHYQLPLSSYSEGYVENTHTLRNLFDQTDYMGRGYYTYDSIILPILIGCVDNNFSRKIMHEYFLSQDYLLYIDVGVEAAKVPQDDRDSSSWTVEEKEAFQKSGWTGQVVCGLRWKGNTILEPVAGRFPDVLVDDDDLAPSELSCSNIVAKEPQRLITNRYASLAVVNYFNELFAEHTISNHVTFITVKSKTQLRSERIEKELTL